jgi:hypothetical protein
VISSLPCDVLLTHFPLLQIKRILPNMDLLDEPHDALPGVEVPLMDITPYLRSDIGKFVDFPRKAGFVLERVWKEAESVINLATFLQSWLLFGSLLEMLERPVSVDDYAMPPKEDTAQKTLCTTPIRALLGHCTTAE